LVDISSRKGAKVADLTPTSVADVFTVRTALESLAAELAASGPDPDAVARLEDINDRVRIEVRAGNRKAFFDLNDEFHRGIADMAGNAYLSSLQVTAAARSFRPLFLFGSDLAHLEDSARDHELILDAIRRGERERSARRMERHILNAQREALRLLHSVGSTPTDARGEA
jgi:DNA-binding GntR family transcriptional regulator